MGNNVLIHAKLHLNVLIIIHCSGSHCLVYLSPQISLCQCLDSQKNIFNFVLYLDKRSKHTALLPPVVGSNLAWNLQKSQMSVVLIYLTRI